VTAVIALTVSCSDLERVKRPEGGAATRRNTHTPSHLCQEVRSGLCIPLCLLSPALHETGESRCNHMDELQGILGAGAHL
jgi:hypothetical protein